MVLLPESSWILFVSESLSIVPPRRGCLLGGAVGDALGAPVEFMDIAEIQRRFGPGGIAISLPPTGELEP